MDRRKYMGMMSLVLAIVVLAIGVNPTSAGPGGGTYYANSPAGIQIVPMGRYNTGQPLRKFVDSLPGLGYDNKNNLGQYIPVAIPDTTSYPGSNYYEIGLRDYTEKMHSDLPKATKLRGYYQINTSDPHVNVSHYLGPLIVAQSGVPVRIKFRNQLGTGAAGNLFLPVDTTSMGAGYGPLGPAGGFYTQNRATLHLHGGNTPWISDGTPHQWTVPAGDPTPYKKGASAQDVPDMPATGIGDLTFYYPNQQSSRLMFYHDHSYGITRLNVYAGEAAGYLLIDAAEEDLINRGIIPNAGGVYKYGIPLIIQDKTFVPQNIDIQDALWDTVKWGQPGDLWFPHVYEPNQNPNSPDGASAFGRWDYGPWFWPPVIVPPANSILPQPSMVPEGFMDTPIVNGTAYPYIQVQPKAYRFRILNACNDRMLNLQLYYVDPANPTEVKMVPALPNTGLPSAWPTDSRDGGVPDPAFVGPSMIQIGTEGGFLPAPVVLPNTPVGYEYNRRNIVVLNVSNKTLFLGPAERADIIIDFSTVPSGSKIILYNDAPAPVPAFDSRNDYYTGNPDQTSGGGAPTTQPGYGPNTRTIMQFQVVGSASPPFNLSVLQNASTGLPAAFAASQPAPIVPEAGYPAPNNVSTNLYAKIEDYSLTFTPIGASRPITLPMQPKAIQELWDPYGRMNATLGVELPFTNNNTQTTIPLGYIDPMTEVVPDGQMQLWKITHNGVDTHAVHFHLYNVQVINRVGWDGQIRPPDANELGWKETVRMHPLEDIIVALQPKSQTGLPFVVPDSNRLLDPTSPLNANISVINPANGNQTTIVNAMTNFGWEYVWHCHLLGHEENDMMRPFVLQVPTVVPIAPSGLTATIVPPVAPATTGNEVELEWTDNSNIAPNQEVGFRIERCAGAGCSNFTPITTVYSDVTSYIDTEVDSNTTYNYRVFAYNAQGDSVASNTATILTSTWAAASGVTLTPSKPSPQGLGSPIVFTASGSGSTAAYEYRFSLGVTGTNTIIQDYSTVSTWTMPASTQAGSYTITVDVRDSGSSATPNATNSIAYVITTSSIVPDGNLGYGVTVQDAMRALLISSGVINPTISDIEHGDVAPLVGGKPQPDQKIDIGDVMVILRKSVGLVSW